MGSGSYSSEAYSSAYRDRDYAHKSEKDLFKNSTRASKSTLSDSFNVNARVNNTSVRPEMLKTGVRESRDNAEHPHTTPIIIAFDVTGSMSRRPQEMIKDQFPKLMDKLQELGVKDPQLLFMAIGDHKSDDYPLQAGQFESDTNKILDSIQELYLEKGGGGNGGESYLLAWIMAGYHTETDSFFKRGRKGFLFTLGDEPCHHSISGEYLIDILGYEKGAKDIDAVDALAKAREQYNVFHIHITNANYPTSYVEGGWRELVGENFLTANSGEVANVIADTIREHYIPEEDNPLVTESLPKAEESKAVEGGEQKPEESGEVEVISV